MWSTTFTSLYYKLYIICAGYKKLIGRTRTAVSFVASPVYAKSDAWNISLFCRRTFTQLTIVVVVTVIAIISCVAISIGIVRLMHLAFCQKAFKWLRSLLHNAPVIVTHFIHSVWHGTLIKRRFCWHLNTRECAKI